MQASQQLPADWTKVLARGVKKALAQAVARLDERQQALAVAPPADQASPPLDFAEYEKRLAALANCPLPAQQKLAEIDVALREGEDALREWLTRADATRRQLALEAGRAVG